MPLGKEMVSDLMGSETQTQQARGVRKIVHSCMCACGVFIATP